MTCSIPLSTASTPTTSRSFSWVGLSPRRAFHRDPRRFPPALHFATHRFVILRIESRDSNATPPEEPSMRFVSIVLLAVGLAGPAWAQWNPVPDIPSTELFSLFANG